MLRGYLKLMLHYDPPKYYGRYDDGEGIIMIPADEFQKRFRIYPSLPERISVEFESSEALRNWDFKWSVII